MGRTEYAIKLTTINDAREVINAINNHNNCKDWERRGEYIYISGYLDFNDKCYMVAGNGGGRTMTSEWFDNYFPYTIEWHGMCDKPNGWYECEDYIWKNEASGENKNHSLPKKITEYITRKTN
jgi:hypothetical protein